MKVTPDDYGRRCQFDHFCKLVLYHEAVDYFRERKRQRGWETSFEALPLSELDTLCTIDQYPSDSFIFPAYPYTFFPALYSYRFILLQILLNMFQTIDLVLYIAGWHPSENNIIVLAFQIGIFEIRSATLSSICSAVTFNPS